MNKDILNIKDTEDLMGFSSPEVVLNHDPKPLQQQFVQDASISNDPFEFILQKAFQNKENTPFLPKENLTAKPKLVGNENSPLLPRENLPKPRLNFKLGDETSPLLYKENLTKWKQGILSGDANSPRPKGNVSKPKLEFSWLNESMMNELDTSYDLLNGSYNLNETFADLTFTAPLRRKSISMGNLTNYGVPLSCEQIKKEANKVVQLLNDPKLNETEDERTTPKEEMLSDVMPRLNNSTSSEDELGLPKILKLSGNFNTSFDLKESEEYKKYRKLSTSLNNISQTEILNTTTEKENTFNVDSFSEENKITNEKPKIESKIKLLQKGINDLPKSLKTVKKPAEKIEAKKGPIKAFPPVNSQKLNSTNKTITRPSTCPIRKNPNDSNSSIIVPVASSTPEKRGSNLSKNSSIISRPRSASGMPRSASGAPKPAITRPSIKASPQSTLGNQRKIPTVGGLKKN